jgi:WD40 repeat protein
MVIAVIHTRTKPGCLNLSGKSRLSIFYVSVTSLAQRLVLIGGQNERFSYGGLIPRFHSQVNVRFPLSVPATRALCISSSRLAQRRRLSLAVFVFLQTHSRRRKIKASYNPATCTNSRRSAPVRRCSPRCICRAMDELPLLPSRAIELEGHSGVVIRIVAIPDSDMIMTACEDNLARVYSTRDGSLLRSLSTGHFRPGRAWLHSGAA